jgi:U3 small nucleolar RNA-associated protein 10
MDRIHEYNTEHVILTFLPYHSTNIFVALLQILPKKIPMTYKFLFPYITSLSNPPFPSIVHATVRTQPFFAAINQYTLKAARAGYASSVLLSFWSRLATQTTDGMIEISRSSREAIQKQRTEDILLRILPILNEALSFGDIPDLAIGCCMIISVLAAKGNLEDKVLDGMMQAIANSWTEPSVDERLACMALLATEREATKLPNAVTKRLLLLDNVTNRLVSIKGRCRVERIATGLALGCIHRLPKRADSKEVETINSLVRSGLLGEHQMNATIRSLLAACSELLGSSLAPADRATLADLMSYLAETPPLNFAFEKALKKGDFNREKIEMALQKVITFPQRPAAIKGDPEPQAKDLPKPTESLSDAMTSISETELPGKSFFSVSLTESFEKLAELYLKALTSESVLHVFCSMGCLKREAAFEDATFFTFFARIWTSDLPALAKSTALRIVNTLLAKMTSKDYDLQNLLPYIICALADPAASVRRAAADLVRVLSRWHKRAQESAGPRNVWADGTLYGNLPGTFRSLPTDETYGILKKVLLPDLEACVLDPNAISTVITVALDGSSEWKTSGLQVASADIKRSRRESVYGFLSSHLAATPLLRPQLMLASALSGAGKAGVEARTKILLPAIKTWASLPMSEAQNRCSQQRVSLDELAKHLLRLVQGREQDAVELLHQIVIGSVGRERTDIENSAFARLREIWATISTKTKTSLASDLLNIAVDPTTIGAPLSRQDRALETLRTLKLSAEVLITLMSALPNAVSMPDRPPSSKRRRTSRNEMAKFEVRDTEDIAKALRKYTLVLELVESTPEAHPELLKPLFHTLAEIQHYAAQTDSGLVYLQGLAINSLLAIVDRLKDVQEAPDDKNAIRTDLLVDCVRNTTNPQVQNAALLLISCLAMWVPDVVLHSVMPIFTFMGNTILRQSDDYSAHVIDQTVSRVVPPLVLSLKKRSRRVISGASDLLLSFTAAFEHMPQHRRLGLFDHVTRTLGPEECLFAVVVMIVDRYPTDARARRFVADLMNLYDPSIELHALKQYVDLITDIFKPRRDISETVLNLKEKNEEQIRTTAVNLLNSLTILMGDTTLRSRLARSFSGEEESRQRRSFSELMEKSISLAPHVKSDEELSVAATRALTNVFKLLPVAELTASANLLLQEQTESVKSVILKSIEAQIRELKNPDKDTRQALLDFIPSLTAVIQLSADPLLRHNAIAVIDQIAERFGKQDTSQVLGAVAAIVESGLPFADERVRIMSLLCLTTAVELLQDDFIPHLPNVMNKAFDYVKAGLDDATISARLFNSVFAFISAVIEYLPYMVGDYLGAALSSSFRCAVSDISEETGDGRQQFYRLAVDKIPAPELYKALNGTFVGAQNDGFDAIADYLKMVKAAIDKHSKSTIIRNSPALFEILMTGFDLRRNTAAGGIKYEYDNDELEQIENLLIQVTTGMTLKLNDATFRPFFTRLVEWAKALPKKDTTGRIARATALFRLLKALFGRLKSLLTSYSSYCIELAADILANALATEDDGERLLGAVLGALEQSFEHDENGRLESP